MVKKSVISISQGCVATRTSQQTTSSRCKLPYEVSFESDKNYGKAKCFGKLCLNSEY